MTEPHDQSLDSYVRDLVATWPPFTAELRARVAVLLRDGSDPGGCDRHAA